MSNRATLGAAVLVGLAVATFASAGGSGSALPRHGNPTVVQARAVVRRFFQTINARNFATPCDLMSVRFYRLNHVPDKRHCVIGLTAGLTMSPTVFFRIITVHNDGEQTVVRAAANGAAGKIVLVNENGTLRILSVGS
jgi:hypothetical protein